MENYCFGFAIWKKFLFLVLISSCSWSTSYNLQRSVICLSWNWTTSTTFHISYMLLYTSKQEIAPNWALNCRRSLLNIDFRKNRSLFAVEGIMDWQVISLSFFFFQKILFKNSATSASKAMLYQGDSSARFADEDLTPGATCARTCAFTRWKNLSSANTARSPFRSLQRFETTPDFTPVRSLTSAMYVTSRTRSLQDCGLIRSLLDIDHYMKLLKQQLKKRKVFMTRQITASVHQTLLN